MTTPLLSLIDAEVERSEREAEFARRIRAFAAELYGAESAPPRAAQGPAAKPASGPPNGGAPKRPPGTNPSLEEICDLVQRKGPIRRGEVHAWLGGNIDSIGDKLQRLARAGRIEAIGPASRRAYRAPAAERDDLGTIVATIAAQSGALDERRISLATRIPLDRVETVCQELLRRRAVERTDRGTLAVTSR